MNKKVVVLGGGTGLSVLLQGLKKFPLDITAIVSVCDNGSSTGKLREEFKTPAVGDIRRVLISLSETEPLVEKLFNYRFSTYSDLNGHAVGNLILTAAKEITGNLSDGIETLSKVFNLKGKVVPLTEDNVTLMAEMKDKTIVEGEKEISLSPKKIKKVFYKEAPVITPEAIKVIKNADAIILSMGSIFTSIIPNLINKEIIDAIDESNAKIIYVSNMVTQPGETDNFKVSDHVNLLNSYLGKRKVDVVLANNKKIDKNILEKYQTSEQKDQVLLDKENLKDITVIEDNYFIIDNGMVRHDALKVAFNIFVEVFKY
jgi:uncharacterized cofD-like protein